MAGSQGKFVRALRLAFMADFLIYHYALNSVFHPNTFRMTLTIVCQHQLLIVYSMWSRVYVSSEFQQRPIPKSHGFLKW